MSKDIHPTPGRALVRLIPFYENTGDIVMPDTVSSRMKCAAELLAFCVGGKEHIDENLVEAIDNPELLVILKPYSGITPFDWDDDENLTLVSVYDIEAVIAKSLTVDNAPNADGAIPRCKSCGPAMARLSTNGHLMVAGPRGYYCPRCYKDVNGTKVDPDEVTLSRDEAHAMLGSPNDPRKTQVGYGD